MRRATYLGSQAQLLVEQLPLLRDALVLLPRDGELFLGVCERTLQVRELAGVRVRRVDGPRRLRVAFPGAMQRAGTALDRLLALCELRERGGEVLLDAGLGGDRLLRPVRGRVELRPRCVQLVRERVHELLHTDQLGAHLVRPVGLEQARLLRGCDRARERRGERRMCSGRRRRRRRMRRGVLPHGIDHTVRVVERLLEALHVPEQVRPRHVARVADLVEQLLVLSLQDVGHVDQHAPVVACLRRAARLGQLLLELLHLAAQRGCLGGCRRRVVRRRRRRVRLAAIATTLRQAAELVALRLEHLILTGELRVELVLVHEEAVRVHVGRRLLERLGLQRWERQIAAERRRKVGHCQDVEARLRRRGVLREGAQRTCRGSSTPGGAGHGAVRRVVARPREGPPRVRGACVGK